jgi:D-tyrosyl-tRNA(Tyr) deacylase
MRAVIQRVNRASVSVDGHITGSIERGICLLIGITHDDTQDEIKYIVEKTLSMRIFPEKSGNSGFDQSVQDIDGGILLVSQFTLYASTRKGRRPSFTDAARPEQAEPMFNELVESFKMNSGLRVETGVFGASMQVETENAGPVTIILDSEDRNTPRRT